MKTFLLFLILTTTCFAQDLTLEERVTNLEQQLEDIPNYVTSNCRLVLAYSGISSFGCFDSVVSNVRTTVRSYNGNYFTVTNQFECKRYQLICR